MIDNKNDDTQKKGPNLNDDRLLYTVDEKPRNVRDAIVLGIQHPLTMIGGMSMTPLIVAGAIGMNPGQTTLLLGLCMIGAGLATVIQTTFGVKLATIQTMSVAFIAAYVAIAGIVTSETGSADPMLIMRYIAGAVILGGIFEAICGYSGLIEQMKRVITPMVTGPVILLICLSLGNIIVEWAASNWLIAIITAAISLSMTHAIPRTKWGKDKYFLKSTAVIVPVSIMFVISLILSLSGVIDSDSGAYINLQAVKDAPWFVLPIGAANWGAPIFRIDFALLVVAGFVISMIESIGQYYGNAAISQVEDTMTGKRVGRGIGAEGLGCILAALVGGLSSTSAGENLGLVEATRVASRHIARIGGCFLILFGLCGKFAAILATISQPILAGVFIAIMGTVGGVGVKEFTRIPLSGRNLSIFGISLIFGIGMPTYITAHPVVFMESLTWLANTINGFASNMMAMGGLVAILMNQIVPGSDDEKGKNAVFK